MSTERYSIDPELINAFNALNANDQFFDAPQEPQEPQEQEESDEFFDALQEQEESNLNKILRMNLSHIFSKRHYFTHEPSWFLRKYLSDVSQAIVDARAALCINKNQHFCLSKSNIQKSLTVFRNVQGKLLEKKLPWIFYFLAFFSDYYNNLCHDAAHETGYLALTIECLRGILEIIKTTASLNSAYEESPTQEQQI